MFDMFNPQFTHDFFQLRPFLLVFGFENVHFMVCHLGGDQHQDDQTGRQDDEWIHDFPSYNFV